MIARRMKLVESVLYTVISSTYSDLRRWYPLLVPLSPGTVRDRDLDVLPENINPNIPTVHH